MITEHMFKGCVFKRRNDLSSGNSIYMSVINTRIKLELH